MKAASSSSRAKAAISSASISSSTSSPRTSGSATRNITADYLVAAARRILHPYTLEVKEIAWWSVYEIGQRLCDRFDDVPERDGDGRFPRVFIAGDACHTHSPKAGQGMNVSMQDGFNLGWKLASVLLGRCSPTLLRTYSDERQAIAAELIDFDRKFAGMISAPPKDPADPHSEGVDPAEFQRYFVMQGRFTAGTATRYAPSIISAEPRHQHLATGLPIGMRFHSAPVIRLADAKPMQLGHAVKADGRWRLFAFAGREDPDAPSSAIGALCAFLAEASQSPVRKYTPQRRGYRQRDRRACHVPAGPPRRSPSAPCRPSSCRPKGRFGLLDYEKMFCPDLEAGARHLRAARHRPRRLHARRAAGPVCRAYPAARCA